MSRKPSYQYYIPPGAQPPVIPGSPIDKSVYPNPYDSRYAQSSPHLVQAPYRTSPAMAMPEPFVTSPPPSYTPRLPSQTPAPTRSSSRYPGQEPNHEAWQFHDSHITRSTSHQSSLHLPSHTRSQVQTPRPRAHSSLGTRPSPQLEVPQANHKLAHKYSYSEDMRHLGAPNGSNGPPNMHQRSPSIASTTISEDFAGLNLDAAPANGLASADSLDKFQRGEGDDTDWAWHLLVTKEARESLPEQEVLRQSAMFELINGERSYVKDLELVKEIFISGLRQSRRPILNPGKVETFIREVFYNMEHVLAHHQRMLAALYALQREQHPILLHLGNIILDHALQFQPDYDTYIKHYPVAESVHRRELKVNDQYRIFLERCSQDPRLAKRDLITFISRPVTRLPRLTLQLEEIKKRTEKLSYRDGDAAPPGRDEKRRTEQDYPDLETIPIVVEILNRFVKSTQPGIAAAEGKVKFYALCESLKFRRGEIIDMDLYNEHRTLVHSGTLLRKERKGNWHVWGEYEVALLDNYFLMTKVDPSTGSKEVKSRPIPLEFLRLGPFNGPAEQERSGGLISAISKPSRPLYPLVISHGASTSRTYTLFAKTDEARQKWKAALVDALGVRRVVIDSNKLFAMSTVEGEFFKTWMHPSSRSGEPTGRISVAVSFSSINRNFIGVATPTGIYFGIKGREYTKVFDHKSVKHMAVLQAFTKLLILHNDVIMAYSLDVIGRIVLGQADPKMLDATAERVSHKPERLGTTTIPFFRVGMVSGRTLVVYASNRLLNNYLHAVEAVLDQPSNILQRIGSRGGGQAPTFRKYGESFYVPKEPFDVTLLAKTIAVSTEKQMTVVDPTNLNNNSTVPIPDFSELNNIPNPENSPLAALKTRTEYAKPLGIVKSAAEELIVIYDEFGCYVTKHAVPTRKCGYVRWEARATAYAERGPHILLFSPNFIEVRLAGTGRLVQVLEGEDIRLVQSQSEHPLMIAKRGKSADARAGLVDELIELLETAPIETPRSGVSGVDASTDRLWDEWE